MSSETRADLAVRARGLAKAYQVFARPQDRLRQILWRGRRRFYSEFHAVRGVDLDLHRGQTIGIVGRNGSGKSTLLKMICGLLEPSAGELEVNGHVAPILALGVGFHPDFTGRENVSMNAALLGIETDELPERIEAIIAFADIGAFFDQPVRSYSSGMAARLAFAVAIHARPDILVIDEVLAVGDEAFTRKCFARIEKLKGEGSTILFVSHASGLVVQLCDRALLMEAGERVLTGDPRTVVTYYHKLLYAAPEDRPDVLHEIRALDAGEKPARTTTSAWGTPERVAVGEDGDGDRYDPHLRPLSTVEYPSRGARILEPRILDRSGARVNLLRPGRDYVYAYEVAFDETAFGVRFGMMIKLVTGFELAGQVSHPWARGLDSVEAGSVVQVRFGFRAALVPGAYFLNAGVLSLADDSEQYLHRILDAVMFRVEAEVGSCVTGQADLTEPAWTWVGVETPPAESVAAAGRAG
jgi:lipopolysaccharide transport system ATP-binding protein